MAYSDGMQKHLVSESTEVIGKANVMLYWRCLLIFFLFPDDTLRLNLFAFGAHERGHMTLDFRHANIQLILMARIFG